MHMAAHVLRIGASGLLTLLLAGLTAWFGPAALATTTRATPTSATPTSATSATSATTILPAGGRAARSQPTYPYNFSTIAWTGHDSVIAATDSHGDLYYFWEAAGSTTWHRQLVAKGTKEVAYTKPAITWTGHGVGIAVVEGSAGLAYFFQPSGSSKWKYKFVAFIPEPRTPSLTTAANGTVLIGEDSKEGKLFAFEQPAGSTVWAGELISSGVFGNCSVATAPDGTNTYLGLMTAVSGGTLYFWWSVLGTTSWNQETIASAGPGVSYAGGSVIATSNDVLVTAATTAGAVDFWSQTIGGTGWTGQTVAAPGSGGAYSNPGLAWNGAEALTNRFYFIAATDHSGNVKFWWRYSPNPPWYPEKVATAGKQAAYENVGISVTKTSTILTAINRKPGNVIYWYQPYGTAPWHKQQVAKG